MVPERSVVLDRRGQVVAYQARQRSVRATASERILIEQFSPLFRSSSVKACKLHAIEPDLPDIGKCPREILFALFSQREQLEPDGNTSRSV